MSTIKSSAEDLTLNADGSGNDIKFQSNGVEKGSLTAEGVLTATSFAGSGANLTGITAPNPNIIINGAMQVAQRSASSTVAQANDSNEGYATLDRWSLQFGNNAGGTITTSQDTESPAGFGTSYKLDVTTADASISGNEIVYASQTIEAQNMRNSGWEYTSTSSDITLSFWVRSSKTGTYCVILVALDTSYMYTAEYTVSSADTWEKKTITVPGHASLVFNNDTGAGLQVGFMLGNASGRYGTAGSWATGNHWGTSNQVNFLDSTSNVMYLTGVKLEVGDTATDYIHRSYAEELRLCQRYYQRYGSPKTFVTTASAGWQDATIWGWCLPLDTDDVGTHHILPVEMRTSPTCSITESHIELQNNGQNFTSGNTLQVQASSSTHMSMHFDTDNGLNVDNIIAWTFQNAAGYYDLSAEL